MHERRKAWDLLDRESEEVKRKIRSHMRAQPESLVIENPMEAGRVSQQYEGGRIEGVKQTSKIRKSDGNPMIT